MDEAQLNKQMRDLARSYSEGKLDYHSYRSRRAKVLDELQSAVDNTQDQLRPVSKDADDQPAGAARMGRWLLLAAVLATGLAVFLLSRV